MGQLDKSSPLLTETQRLALRSLAKRGWMPMRQGKVIGGYSTATLEALISAGLAFKVKGKVVMRRGQHD